MSETIIVALLSLLGSLGGTLLYSYTYEDAQQISEFPDAPTHEGLTFQNWNWSEVVAKTWLQNHRGGQLKVGTTYTPTDGQDHNYWRSPRLTEPSQIYMQHRATTSVGDQAFYDCNSLVDVVLHGKPALGGSVVFGNNPSNQRFYVHRSDLAWFETATNWSAIYGEGKIVAAADYIEYLQSIGVDTTDFEGE